MPEASTKTDVEYMNESAAGRVVGISRHAMRQLRINRRGPKHLLIRCGTRAIIRYRRDHLDQWIRKNTQGDEK